MKKSKISDVQHRDRESIQAKLKEDLDEWKLQFAEAGARGPEHTGLLAQQFRVGYLAVRYPERDGADRHFIPRNTTLTIGSGKNADIQVIDASRFISKLHALLEAEEDAVYLVDMSTNGTFIEGENTPIGPTRRRLKAGDSFRLGDVEATFHPLA